MSLDFETANAKRGSVIQIGVVRVIDGRVLTPFASFVTPPPGLGQFAPR
ncbi:DNA polymerase III, partial [Rathayibacter rathayi]